ncbi:nucleotide exchange factor GrpE [Persicimonas caeni]|uniref:Protein GrpE n=1 Tax=Persicimonas caeni TaxID=2292766 RepID=A0A4Y6PZM0_PERCE|nr:nucleotide exchange factor GrpE [Persicimonas caeni]QDG53457.1 nucleotide exchange factor GrpE [Persicimonas caeni]QED34678.1 nucleotide exchange factor GrpE [Persicimonas caeni]
MVFPYDKRPRGSGSRYVPLDVARQIAQQRDELLAEVQKLRRQNNRLESAVEAADSKQAALSRRVAEAEREARELRAELAEQADLAEQPREHQPEEQQDAQGEQTSHEERAEVHQETPAEHLVARLSQRIEELEADLDRVRERTQRTVDNARRDERVRILAGLGAVLDSIERGLDIGADTAWRRGLEAIRSQLMAFFRAEGATLLGEPGERMNPKIHEAIQTVDADGVDKGHIVEVERHGLQLEDGTLVRPAKVVVAR